MKFYNNHLSFSFEFNLATNSDTPEPSQEFLLQKLESGSGRLWHEIQQKMKTFILENNMSHFKFEAFLQVLKMTNRYVDLFLFFEE